MVTPINLIVGARWAGEATVDVPSLSVAGEVPTISTAIARPPNERAWAHGTSVTYVTLPDSPTCVQRQV
jgi:hypothetical protein